MNLPSGEVDWCPGVVPDGDNNRVKSDPAIDHEIQGRWVVKCDFKSTLFDGSLDNDPSWKCYQTPRVASS